MDKEPKKGVNSIEAGDVGYLLKRKNWGEFDCNEDCLGLDSYQSIDHGSHCHRGGHHMDQTCTGASAGKRSKMSQRCGQKNILLKGIFERLPHAICSTINME